MCFRLGKLIVLFAFTCIFIPSLSADESKVTISIAPDQVWLVPGNDMHKVNFDFLVTSSTDSTIEFDTIHLDVFDKNDQFVTNRELNYMGMCPSIQTIPFTEISPGETVIVFNPFQEFPSQLPLDKLHFTFTFYEVGRDQPLQIEVAIEPQVFIPQTVYRCHYKGESMWMTVTILMRITAGLI